MTDLTLSHRQPVAPTADVARGPQPPKAASVATGGVRPRSPAGTLLIIVAALFAIASAVFLSGPFPFHLLTDAERIGMGLIWAGAALAFGGAAVFARAVDEVLPPLSIAILKNRARFQRISRRQIRPVRQRFMRREFGDLVDALSMAGRVEAALARVA